MENTAEVEDISIYDEPKRGRQGQQLVNYPMKKSGQKREANFRCYYNNYEYYSLQKRSYKRTKNGALKNQAQTHEV